ncbi:MAG: surface antigen [Firmicutes bacterium]|nr:surface antigen [Bacillota bacterium]
MRTTTRFSKLLLATALTMCIMFSAVAPMYAADLTGKTVTAVEVSGNITVPESTIMAAVQVKPGDTFEAEKIKQDMKAIYDLGNFFDVTVNFTEVPEGVKIVFAVMENPTLSDIVIKGNTKVSTEKLKSLLTVDKGKVLNTKALRENARIIENYYHDQGYILARVSDVSLGDGGKINLTINEGTLEDIVIKGNEKTKSYVITREMKVKQGEPFNANDARRSMQRLYNLGFFEDVNMKLNAGVQPNSVVLETDVTEQKTGTFSIGAGYSESDGMVGIIEVGDNNFRGTGDAAKVYWEFGGDSISNGYRFSYTKPWLDKKQTSLSVNWYDLTNKYSDYGTLSSSSNYTTVEDGTSSTCRSTYYKNVKGFDLTLGRAQGEYLHNYFTIKNRRDTWVKAYSGVDYSGSAYDAYREENFGLTRSASFSRVFDSRDNVFSPTEGTRFAVTAEFAGRALGGDFNFNKYTVEDRNYFKVGHSQVIATRVTAGYAEGNLPLSQKFSVGGSDSLRGYDDDQFTGKKMMAATVEYRFPIVKKVEGVFFGDLGNAWDRDDYKLNDLKGDVGFGIRLNTPLGPIRLDYARGENGGKTSFSFGGQF